MCMIDGADETYDVYTDRWVMSARKEHRCTGCRRTIEIGEQYRSTFGLYDNRWMGACYCHHCTFATRWLFTNCGGYLDDGVLEDIQYHLEEEIHSGDKLFFPMARVAIGMGRGWMHKGKLMALPHEIPNMVGHA